MTVFETAEYLRAHDNFLILTHTRSPIHDLVAKTVTVDFASQMIFDSEEALLAYKTKLHEEKARRAEYP